MKAVPLDASEVGAFYNGDSYLVLQNRGEQGADLHMWIGETWVGSSSRFLLRQSVKANTGMQHCAKVLNQVQVFQKSLNGVTSLFPGIFI